MITVVVPISPIPAHPDTTMLQTTLDSVRHHLPDAEIILTFDGVRREQTSRTADYQEHIRRVLELADHHYGNTLPLLFGRHLHQTGMMRAALHRIDTPLVLYVEHDTPLVTDEPINWAKVRDHIETGQSNLVRFHHEGVIPAEHQHMMHGRDDEFIRTSQWSQRPHLASTAFYRRIMDNCFTTDANSFIEDKMHGVCDEAFRIDGIDGWYQYRLHIYSPFGDNIKRSYHLDGRAGDTKYDGSQIF